MPIAGCPSQQRSADRARLRWRVRQQLSSSTELTWQGVERLRWHIVELTHSLLASGRKNFQTDELLFHDSIEDCLAGSESRRGASIGPPCSTCRIPIELLDRHHRGHRLSF